jgi:hypothetical protein
VGFLEVATDLRLVLPKAVRQSLESPVQPALKDLQLPPPRLVFGRGQGSLGHLKVGGQPIQPTTLVIQHDLQGAQAPFQLTQCPIGGLGSEGLILEPIQGRLRPGDTLR